MWNSLIFYHWHLIPYSVSVSVIPFPDSGFHVLVLPGSKQAKRSKTKKVEFLERQFHSKKLSFARKKESEHSLEISLPTCVFYRRIFNLEMQNFSLENQHMMNVRQPFCWRITSTKGVKFAGFFPTPYVVVHLTSFGGEVGVMGDWVWARIFFPKPLELDIFSLTYNGVRFFFQHYIRH